MSAPDIETILREDAPQPDPAFADRLGERAAQGFARPRRLRFPPLIPALATACALVAVAVVGIALIGGGGGGNTRQESVAAGAAQAQRKIERSIRMTLAAAHGKLAEMAAHVGEVASTHGGYVLGSELSTGQDGTRSGQFTLRIPSAQVEPALADLSRLGEVRQRDESSRDMTASYSHVRDRLANALLERSETAQRLRGAKGAEAARLRIHLRVVSADVRQLGSKMRDLRRRTSMSTVEVDLEEKGASNGGGVFGGDPGDAFGDVAGVLAGGLNFAIRMLPLIVLALLGGLGTRALRRRRREAALF